MKAGFQYPVSPLIGCNLNVLNEIEKRFTIDSEYLVKYRRTKLLSRVLHEMARFDRIRYRSLQDQVSLDLPPVFIIGHWRSGTSFLHNLLCQVYPAAYTTTYHSVFPNNLFAFKGLIKFFMWVFMPRKRPTDAMKMHPDLPQEEELALGQERFFSFYYWFYFPKQVEQLADEYMYLEDPQSTISKEFQQHYREYIRRCKMSTRGEVFISKNPTNTARIPVLLDQFPNARFIYLKRDPYETLQSSMLFFQSVLKGNSFQKYDKGKVDCFLLGNYKRMIHTYLDKKNLIPADHLIEISYEELIKYPTKTTAVLTEQLNLGVKADLSKVEDYLAASRDFPSRKYRYSNGFLKEVNDFLGDLIETQGYPIRNT